MEVYPDTSILSPGSCKTVHALAAALPTLPPLDGFITARQRLGEDDLVSKHKSVRRESSYTWPQLPYIPRLNLGDGAVSHLGHNQVLPHVMQLWMGDSASSGKALVRPKYQGQ
jgi:hypothetical protein